MGKLIQQINLYQPRFQRELKSFTFGTLVLLMCIAIAAMGALSGYGHWQKRELQKQWLAVEKQRTELQSRVDHMRQMLPEPSVNQQFEQQLERLQIERQTGYALLNVLEGRIQNESLGFSAFFEGLARQSEPGIWFESIELNRASDYTALTGKVTDPQLLPQFLQKLENEESFRNKAFRVVKMQRDEENASQISFDLRSETEQPE